MVAIYPTNIRNFTYKTDFTDIVNAGDVNSAYDEIKAIETTLGTMPQTDLIDNTTKTWLSVDDRMTALRKNVSSPYANVVINNVNASFQTLPSFTGKTWDTHNMWNGSDKLVCPRTGVYTISYTVRWYQGSLPGTFNSSGFIKSSLKMVGDTDPFIGVTEYFPVGWTVRIEQSASVTVPWVQGQAFYLILNQNIMPNIPISASISAMFHRDGPTSQNL